MRSLRYYVSLPLCKCIHRENCYIRQLKTQKNMYMQCDNCVSNCVDVFSCYEVTYKSMQLRYLCIGGGLIYYNLNIIENGKTTYARCKIMLYMNPIVDVIPV